MVERLAVNQNVTGSSPVAGAILMFFYFLPFYPRKPGEGGEMEKNFPWAELKGRGGQKRRRAVADLKNFCSGEFRWGQSA